MPPPRPCAPLLLRACALAALLARSAWGARVAGSAAGPPWAPGGVLPPELVWQVLALTPRPVRVAWSTGGPEAALLELGSTSVALRDHEAGVVVVRFFPRGERLLTVGADGAGVVWDAYTGRPVHALRHSVATARVFDAQVFPDGDRVVTIGDDHTTVVWSVRSGRAVQRLRHTRAQCSVRVLAAGDRVITGISRIWADPAIIWSVADGVALHHFVQSDSTMLALEVSPCGSKVVTLGFDILQVWSAATGRLQLVLPRFSMGAHQIAVGPGVRRVLDNVGDRIFVWDGTSGFFWRTLELSDDATGLAFVDGGRGVAVLTIDGGTVWDMASIGPPRALNSSGWEALRVSVAAAGRLFAACGALPGGPRAHARVWDTATGRALLAAEAPAPQGDAAAVCSIALSHTGSMAEELAG